MKWITSILWKLRIVDRPASEMTPEERHAEKERLVKRMNELCDQDTSAPYYLQLSREQYENLLTELSSTQSSH